MCIWLNEAHIHMCIYEYAIDIYNDVFNGFVIRVTIIPVVQA